MWPVIRNPFVYGKFQALSGYCCIIGVCLARFSVLAVIGRIGESVNTRLFLIGDGVWLYAYGSGVKRFGFSAPAGINGLAGIVRSLAFS